MKHTAVIIMVQKYAQQSNISFRMVVLFGLCAVVCYALGALTVTLVAQQAPDPIIIEKTTSQ